MGEGESENRDGCCIFLLIAGIPAFGQAVLPTQGVVDDVVYSVLDGPGGSLFPDVFYNTLQSIDMQSAAFRVTTEFRDGRKVTPTVVFRTATLGRWKDVVRVTVLSCSRPRAFTKFDNALRKNVFFREGYGTKEDSVGKRGRMFSAYRCVGVLDCLETGFASIPSFFIL